MAQRQTKRIETISDFHRSRGFSQPEHPLISIVDYSKIERPPDLSETNWVFDFYQIALKRGINAKIQYGQQQYDFDDGIMFFISPNQVFRIEPEANVITKKTGWLLSVHPDFFLNTSLANTIKQYDFFDYSLSEALFVSGKEETTINAIIANIKQEYNVNIDKFTKQIIISQIESLLSYADRFYSRQFITREKTNHQILQHFEIKINEYFNQENLIDKGLPTVQNIAEQLNLSPKYLTSLLQNLTGQTTQQHIHEKLIEKAKEKLSATNLSVSEIAYELGFEHPQSFSKLFKTKTNQSPLAFRQSFN